MAYCEVKAGKAVSETYVISAKRDKTRTNSDTAIINNPMLVDPLSNKERATRANEKSPPQKSKGLMSLFNSVSKFFKASEATNGLVKWEPIKPAPPITATDLIDSSTTQE
jgi:hypothetical protein